MKNYYDSVRSERQLKSATGLGKQEFEKLLQAFEQAMIENSDEKYLQNRNKRSRRPGGGRKGKLETPENKVFFILFYLKIYPTFDVLGLVFDLNPSKAEENVKKRLPILKRAQSKLNVLPRRILKIGSELEDALETVAIVALEPESSELDIDPKMETGFVLENALETVALEPESSESYLDPKMETASALEDTLEIVSSIYKVTKSPTPDRPKEPKENASFENIETLNNDTKLTEIVKTEAAVFIDVTERAHFRHQNNAKQKKHYSGKQKRHTVKNTIVSDSKQRVIFLGSTNKGSTHDYKMFQKETK